jgi:glutathione S-transferase
MRVLYHYPTSTFSRRTRLVLAHKGLDVELRDARAVPEHEAEARALSPLGTMPLLVDDGRAIGDSTCIAHYLDLAYPDRPRLFPSGADAAARALAITSHVDLAMNTLVDMGTRYYPLRNDPAWKDVLAARMERAEGAMNAVAKLATQPLLTGGGEWGAAEIWALSSTLWVKGFPARAATAPLVAQIITLGFRLPDALVTWASQHEGRPDVKAIYGA